MSEESSIHKLDASAFSGARGMTRELGTHGEYDPSHGLRYDEFLPQLRNDRGMRKYREMRDNDPVIGSILTAMDMSLRSVDWRIEPSGTTAAHAEAAEFVRGMLFEDMESSFSEFISDALSFLPFGFSLFEIVLKRRKGRNRRRDEMRSKFDDGMYGIASLASRAQWTIDRFEVTPTGRILGAYQRSYRMDLSHVGYEIFLPKHKLLHFRTSTVNDMPSGRSVLRNAFVPYHYVTNIQRIEAIAIEREMNGLPVGRLPAEYLDSNASASQKAFLDEFKRILRDVKRNEQGYIVLPSDNYVNENGTISNSPMVSVELIASKGTRDIDTSKVVQRHYHNIARTVLADFVMLGQSERGSFALSQNKTDLFMQSLEGYAQVIKDGINRQLMPLIWSVNGLDPDLMPLLGSGNIAPEDLKVLGDYVDKVFGGEAMPRIGELGMAHLAEVAGIPASSEEGTVRPGQGEGA